MNPIARWARLLKAALETDAKPVKTHGAAAGACELATLNGAKLGLDKSALDAVKPLGQITGAENIFLCVCVGVCVCVCVCEHSPKALSLSSSV